MADGVQQYLWVSSVVRVRVSKRWVRYPVSIPLSGLFCHFLHKCGSKLEAVMTVTYRYGSNVWRASTETTFRPGTRFRNLYLSHYGYSVCSHCSLSSPSFTHLSVQQGSILKIHRPHTSLALGLVMKESKLTSRLSIKWGVLMSGWFVSWEIRSKAALGNSPEQFWLNLRILRVMCPRSITYNYTF